MFEFSRRCVASASLALAATGVVIAGCTSSTATEATRADSAALQLPGQTIAETFCSGCHAIGRTGESPHIEALPFRQISSRYPVRDLEEALGEGILVGHPDMPPFAFEPDDIDALLTYIEAIQDPA